MRRLAVIGAIATAIAGCSAIADLPDQPAQSADRSTSVGAYPAVHDTPPSRPDPALSDAEQEKVQAELRAAGQSQPTLIEEIERDANPPPQQAQRPARPRREAAGSRQNP